MEINFTKAQEVMALEKLETLRAQLKALGRVAIAFSGGVDSTFLLAVAHEVLGDKAVAITNDFAGIPRRDVAELQQFCEQRRIPLRLMQAGDLSAIEANQPDRCYHCKKSIFSKLKAMVAERGLGELCEGSNMDDLQDYRPGHKAIVELLVKSPLQQAELTKQEIRWLSQRLGLPTWDKQSAACLASRFVYGERITERKLAQVEAGEEVLRTLGFTQYRVRVHGDLARIEALPQEFDLLMEHREEVASKLRALGYAYVTLDLLGYRMGSMNETIKKAYSTPYTSSHHRIESSKY